MPFFQLHKKMQTGLFQIAMISWGCWYKDPSYNLEIFSSKDKVMNTTKWEDEYFNQLLDEAKVTADKSEREKKYIKAEKHLLKHMPVIPLLQKKGYHLKQDNLKNVFISNLDEIDFKEAYFA